MSEYWAGEFLANDIGAYLNSWNDLQRPLKVIGSGTVGQYTNYTCKY